MEKKEILAIVREHMADCAGISQRDIEDHGERIAFRIDRMGKSEKVLALEVGIFTQGVCGDGAVILKDGMPMTIEEVLFWLNAK